MEELPPTIYHDFQAYINVYHSAVATFHAPSDLSGIGGMRRETIRATRSWRNGPPRYDTIFIRKNGPEAKYPGMRGLQVARAFLLFSFAIDGTEYPCALVQGYDTINPAPDEDTGMWVVAPEFSEDDSPYLKVVHIGSIVRAAHLIPVYGESFVAGSHELDNTQTLDNFAQFYVNKYVDHHSHEIAF